MVSEGDALVESVRLGAKGEVEEKEEVRNDSDGHQEQDPPVVRQVLLDEAVDEGHVDGDDSSRDGPTQPRCQPLVHEGDGHDAHGRCHDQHLHSSQYPE